MVVWANNEVFLQIWIGAEDKLPRRIRAQFRADPKGLRHDLELSNWQLDGALPAETFSTAKAKAGPADGLCRAGPQACRSAPSRWRPSQARDQPQ